MSVLEQARALAAQLESLKAAARAELVEARKRVAELEAIVGDDVPSPRQILPVGTARVEIGKPVNPLDETDFGMRTPSDGGGNGNATYEEFKDDLAAMRERSSQRPARQARR